MENSVFSRPCMPLPIEDALLNDVVQKAKEFAQMHGICMRRKENFSLDYMPFAPFVLLPSPFPRAEFERVVAVQTDLNLMMHAVAHDRKFITDTLANTIKVDDFTKRLFEIYETVWNEGLAQSLSLGMLRSDVMLQPLSSHATDVSVKQVEINTIASGFGWLGPASGILQRYILEEFGRKDIIEKMPENHALEGLSKAMLDAWELYGNPSAVILFIVEDVSYNICDQRFHEFEMRRQNPDARVVRRTLTQMADSATLDAHKRLFVDGKEVGVVYFRCGYSPEQYPSDREWAARLTIERSRAIKSPSIHYHLAGTKKVQQELARPGVLERFVADEAARSRIRSVFTGLYPLDFDPEGDAALEQAVNDPLRFVLKPQREGGGNNVYGSDIKPFLEKIRHSSERSAYILMDKIEPPVLTNYMVRPNSETKLVECISELGIFGYIIGDANRVLVNCQVGHMLRTKQRDADEGGVAAGLGALDSVFLV